MSSRFTKGFVRSVGVRLLGSRVYRCVSKGVGSERIREGKGREEGGYESGGEGMVKR